jgi:hypothetical protein
MKLGAVCTAGILTRRDVNLSRCLILLLVKAKILEQAAEVTPGSCYKSQAANNLAENTRLFPKLKHYFYTLIPSGDEKLRLSVLYGR